MDNSIIQRFQMVIEHVAKGNRSEFGRMTGKKPSHITDICKGRTSLTMPYLVTLKEKFKISLNWLLVNDGTMLSESVDDEFIYVPLYDVQASAGYGAVIHSEQIVDHLAFKRQWLNQDLGVVATDLALITVKGDSMVPTLNEGDLILIDLSLNQVTQEGVYLIQFEGTLMAKRLQKDYEQNLHVISDNKLYKEFVIPASQMEHLQIIGKTMWFGRKV